MSRPQSSPVVEFFAAGGRPPFGTDGDRSRFAAGSTTRRQGGRRHRRCSVRHGTAASLLEWHTSSSPWRTIDPQRLAASSAGRPFGPAPPSLRVDPYLIDRSPLTAFVPHDSEART